jgi:hypothetical protein
MDALGQGLVEGSCKQSLESSGSTKGEGFLGEISDYYIIKLLSPCS